MASDLGPHTTEAKWRAQGTPHEALHGVLAAALTSPCWDLLAFQIIFFIARVPCCAGGFSMHRVESYSFCK